MKSFHETTDFFKSTPTNFNVICMGNKLQDPYFLLLNVTQMSLNLNIKRCFPVIITSCDTKK